MILVRFMNLKFLRWTRRETGGNIKFTALAAFGVISAVAHAQGAGDTLSQLRACAMLEQAERLECLAKLPRNIAPPLREARDTDNWVVSETFSPIDYTPIVSATTSYRRGADSSAMQLAIHCRGGRTELVVTGSAVQRSGAGYTISYRINDDQPVKFAATAPSFGTGAAFTGDIVRLVQSFPERGGIAIRLAAAADVVDGYFFLGGLKTVRDKVSAACRWPQALSAPRN
jgi:hypothetical protein